MFLKVYKYIGIFMIALVLLGHHSLQAQAMDSVQHESQISCTSECDHPIDMEVCEKIQSDQMHIPSQHFILPRITTFVNRVVKKQITFCDVSAQIDTYRTISHQELARSHLS